MPWLEFPPNTQVRCPLCNHRIADTMTNLWAYVKPMSSTVGVEGVLSQKCKCKRFLALKQSTEPWEQAA